MKKISIIIAIAAILLSVSGCSTYSNQATPKEPVSFYYCSQSSDHSRGGLVIDAELREALGHKDDPQYLISLYLSGPISYQFSSPFPAGVLLQDLTVKDGNADVTLSSQISQLTDYDATLAFACFVLTVDAILDVQSVTIRAKDALINDSPSITLTPDSFAFPAEIKK